MSRGWLDRARVRVFRARRPGVLIRTVRPLGHITVSHLICDYARLLNIVLDHYIRNSPYPRTKRRPSNKPTHDPYVQYDHAQW